MDLVRICDGQAEQDRIKAMLTTGSSVALSVASVPSAAPAGGTGSAAGGWDTAGDRDLAIATINGLVTLCTELQAQLNAVLNSLKTSKIIT